MELGANKTDNGQKEEEQPAEKVPHSLLSRMLRQLSVWMTAGRPSKEVPAPLPTALQTWSVW